MDMSKNRKWTEEELKILHERYRLDGTLKLSNLLDRPAKSIASRAYYEGLTGDTDNYAELALARRKASKDAALRRHSDPERKKDELERNSKNAYAIRKWKIENGVCIRCRQPALENCQLCLLHWSRACASSACGRHDNEFADLLLKKLEGQNYKCALTGDVLLPGLNASIDHIIPKSKGGSIDNLDNLQWVTIHANHAKYDCELEDFINFCKKIVENHEFSA